MNILTSPIEQPVLDGGPGIVDSLGKYARAVKEGKARPSNGESAEDLYREWYVWGEFIITHLDLLDEKGITYWVLDHNQPPMDFPPGKNRVSLFNDFKSRQYETALLERFNVNIRYLGSVGIQDLLKGRAFIDPPYVLKDTNANKGRRKILVEDEEKHRKVISLLSSRRQASLKHFIAEEYCESSSNYYSSYRINMTPGGTIHSVAITRSTLPKLRSKATLSDTGDLLAPLISPGNPYFINPPRIVSNMDGQKAYIGLDFPGRWYELAQPTEEDCRVLEDYDIDPENPVIPANVLEAATMIGRVLGPGIGMHVGIDLIQAKGGDLHLLEVNSNPAYNSIYETMSSAETQPSRGDLRYMAFRTTVDELADGVFAETSIAA